MQFEEINVKHSAYVLVARFIEAYESPPPLVTQIFAQLLRSHQPEARTLVRQALDILTATLPKRCARSLRLSPHFPRQR